MIARTLYDRQSAALNGQWDGVQNAGMTGGTSVVQIAIWSALSIVFAIMTIAHF